MLDYGYQAYRDVTNKTCEDVEQAVKELVQLGRVSLKADLYPWQASHPLNQAEPDVIDYKVNRRRPLDFRGW